MKTLKLSSPLSVIDAEGKSKQISALEFKELKARDLISLKGMPVRFVAGENGTTETILDYEKMAKTISLSTGYAVEDIENMSAGDFNACIEIVIPLVSSMSGKDVEKK